MTVYRNKGGVHVLLDGTVVPRGGTFVSEDPDLLKKFREKFEIVHDAPVPAPDASSGIPGAEIGATSSTPPSDSPPQTGSVLEGTTDVTVEFPSAGEAHVRVLKDKRGLWVYDNEGEDPANNKPLKKREVDGFIKELVV